MSHYQVGHYLKTFFKIKKPGVKAIILDSLLEHSFSTVEKTKPYFSNLFLNSGAHIQHHYLFNSKGYSGNQKNPKFILSEYDKQIGNC